MPSFVFAAAGVALVLAVFLAVRSNRARPDVQTGQMPASAASQAPSNGTPRESTGLNTLTASSRPNRSQVRRNSSLLRAGTVSRPEVLVPPDEREALARFVATLREHNDVALDLATPGPHSRDTPVSFDPLRINRLEIKPLEDTDTFDGASENQK
jgi:hypothetical protein